MSDGSEQAPLAIVRVLAAVVRQGDAYLVCQRPAHKRHGGLWEFPGGKIEAGESDFEGMARELAEELGVVVSTVDARLFEIRDPGSPFLIAFLPVTIVGTPQCIEHSAVTWATLDSLLALHLAPSDRRFVEYLHTTKTPHPAPARAFGAAP